MRQRRYIEHDKQDDEQGESETEADDDGEELPAAVKLPEGDVRHDSEGDQEAEEETEQVRPVVKPWQHPEEKEYYDRADQFEDGDVRSAVHLVTLQHLHQQAGQHPELGSGRT